MANDDDKKIQILRIVLFALVAVFAVGAVACAISYAVLKLDILFIPMALCAVFALILFTYARSVSR